MPNRRTFKRFDIITVLEFKLLTAIAGTFAGITRNFSYEGACLETQCVTFEKGDSLELMLKHPHSDVTVSVPAYVVWKKTADKFASLMGIKLIATELDTRLKMLEIMSAAGDIPVDSFLSNEKDEESEQGDIAASASESAHLKTDRPLTRQAEAHEKDNEPEKFGDEESRSREGDLIPGSSEGNTFGDVLNAAQPVEQHGEEMPEEEGVESDIPWPGDNFTEDETGEAPGTPRTLRQLLTQRIFIYSSIAAVILGVAAYTFFLLFERSGSDMNIQSQAAVPSAISLQDEKSLDVAPAEDTVNDEGAAEAVPLEEERNESTGRSSAFSDQEVPAVRAKPVSADDQMQYIQLGAWKNRDNAIEMLQKVKKYYPDAYLAAGKNFTRVKIPARGRMEVSRVIKDIEDKFRIKPLVSSVR